MKTNDTSNPVPRHPQFAGARLRAKNEGKKWFLAICLACDETSFHTTSNGNCHLCTEKPRTIARIFGHTQYMHKCEKHGETAHSTIRGKCLTCFTAMGFIRAPRATNNARTLSRHYGLTTYIGKCELHGDVDHHTIRGKCLTCYNSLGYPRRRPL